MTPDVQEAFDVNGYVIVKYVRSHSPPPCENCATKAIETSPILTSDLSTQSRGVGRDQNAVDVT